MNRSPLQAACRSISTRLLEERANHPGTIALSRNEPRPDYLLDAAGPPLVLMARADDGAVLAACEVMHYEPLEGLLTLQHLAGSRLRARAWLEPSIESRASVSRSGALVRFAGIYPGVFYRIALRASGETLGEAGFKISGSKSECRATRGW